MTLTILWENCKKWSLKLKRKRSSQAKKCPKAKRLYTNKIFSMHLASPKPQNKSLKAKDNKFHKLKNKKSQKKSLKSLNSNKASNRNLFAKTSHMSLLSPHPTHGIIKFLIFPEEKAMKFK